MFEIIVILQWMNAHTRQYKIRNETNKESVGVASIVAMMVESRHRWFGHVWIRPIEASLRRVDMMVNSLIV